MKRAAQYCVIIALHIIVFQLVSGCARHPSSSFMAGSRSYVAEWSGNKEVSGFSPAFTVFSSHESYNTIGKVEAVSSQGDIDVRVNGQVPAIYYSTSSFSTSAGKYLNYAYRIHFERIPFSLIPFHLAAGSHPGILVIVTVDDSDRPQLITVVNTCGCYAATIPTALLAQEKYPPLGFERKKIQVYGETLPAVIGGFDRQEQIVEILIRPEVHRVMDIRVVNRNEFSDRSPVVTPLYSMETLRKLPVDEGKSVSFYYENWPLTGHVRGAVKWWEMLLLGIPSLDLLVGMDKDFGDTKLSGNPFYTSLKPWNRKASDLNDFASYLRFNGWGL